ncbi:lipoprotein [Pseudobowmanella zhangzhouensis]
MSKFFRLISACLLLAILSACGQKGPLFLPEPLSTESADAGASPRHG